VEWAYEKANRTNVKENIELLLKILEEAEFNQEWINEYKQGLTSSFFYKRMKLYIL